MAGEGACINIMMKINWLFSKKAATDRQRVLIRRRRTVSQGWLTTFLSRHRSGCCLQGWYNLSGELLSLHHKGLSGQVPLRDRGHGILGPSTLKGSPPPGRREPGAGLGFHVLWSTELWETSSVTRWEKRSNFF